MIGILSVCLFHFIENDVKLIMADYRPIFLLTLVSKLFDQIILQAYNQ